MRRLGPCLLFLIAATACGSKEATPAATPSTPAASASSSGGDANRALTEAECESLAQTLLATCDKRGNTHSMQLDRWCSDLGHRVTDGSWVAKECVPRIRFIDGTCFQSATNVTS